MFSYFEPIESIILQLYLHKSLRVIDLWLALLIVSLSILIIIIYYLLNNTNLIQASFFLSQQIHVEFFINSTPYLPKARNHQPSVIYSSVIIIFILIPEYAPEYVK
jgi:hypothetical protein